MTLTVAQIEAEIIARTGGYLVKAKLPATATGTNTALRGPIARALRDVGITPTDPFQATDEDLVAVQDGNTLDETLDRAELRTLESIAGNLTSTTINLSGLMLFKSDLLRTLTERIAQVTKRNASLWGVPKGGLTAMSIPLDFEQEEC